MTNYSLVRILVAEDDDDAIGLYKAALESNGHELVVARDGQECIKSFADGVYDMIILDYKIPFIDGLQVAKEILSKRPKQRIILASAYPEETFGDSSEELRNTIQLFPKPFAPDAIVEAIEGALIQK